MNFVMTIKKLQKAINLKGYHLLYCTSEFYSNDLKRPVTIYYIKNAIISEEGNSTEVLFKSSSQLRIVFFLRDILDLTSKDYDIQQMTEIALDLQKTYKTKHDYMTGG